MPPSKEIKISFIIVNYRSASLLEKCVRSLFEKLGDADFEIIVVNNDPEKLSEFSRIFPGIKIIEHNLNSGFASANNMAAGKSAGKILVLLNPDTEIINFNAEELIKYFEKNKNSGIVGARLVSSNGEIQQWSAGKEPTLFDTLLNNIGIIQSKKIWNSGTACEADWVSGAALFIRKNVFKELGGFDENFFMYFEDADLCLRARQAGWKVIYYPGMAVLHRCGQSSDDKKTIKSAFYASQDYFFQKHRPKWEGCVIKTLRKIFLQQ